MKLVSRDNETERCKSCEQSIEAHTPGGKCLYGPGYLQPWRCFAYRCGANRREFVMRVYILRDAHGNDFHAGCVDSQWSDFAIVYGDDMLAQIIADNTL